LVGCVNARLLASQESGCNVRYRQQADIRATTQNVCF
jgi:hypothetical protein